MGSIPISTFKLHPSNTCASLSRNDSLLQLELPRAHLILDGPVQPVGDRLQPLPALLLRQGQLAVLPAVGVALAAAPVV